ncbi:hypothetical protein DEU56DRAFT_537692 [Suillus clintonianus]|uniref:uncharacterized protein n=1 Tax=Suillus clintonianus TaxID=1904413 RepID=UPI001B874C17|nr:uncharacterized protein DEU56DRAFT_537692 [Suillus clintonianus]KAG2126840.1 hypothetical protein DEU56DRAFT_537692 [Suillus clintonianus]
MAPKMLLIFCEGTSMDGNVTEPDTAAQSVRGDANADVENCEIISSPTPRGGSSTKQHPTNVLRLSRSVKSQTANGKQQIVFYQSGVASEANFAGDQVIGTTIMRLLGTSAASKIRDAYAFIAQNYEDGDEICLFGFSRGAYTARKLSGLIDRIGLLTRQNLGQFFLIWRQLVDGKTPDIPSDTRHPRIKCVGVWDTVGSVFATVDALAITDTSLPATIDIALHALSLQENRQKFLPTLWTMPQGGLAPNQTLKQVWFPGSHEDVGGGHERRELQDIALFWMAGEIKSFVELDLDFLRSTRQQNPDPWGTSQPHNAYMETSWVGGIIYGHETRLQSGQITTTSPFHQSLQFSPQTLTAPKYMVTTSIIQKQFGTGYYPDYPPLNEFEEYCRTNWDKQPKHAKPPIFDDPGDVILFPVNWTPGTQGILPPSAIEGGHESNGDLLYVARAPYAGGLHPGKASSECMYISYGGKEIIVCSLHHLNLRFVTTTVSDRWRI